MKPEFPVYEFLITDDDEDISGVNTISLVSKPAIKSDFVKFSDTPMQKYIFIEKDAKKYKGIVAGIAMKPNELIPRVNNKGEKFYGYFSPETIDRIRTKFHSNPENLKSVNLEHSDKSFVNAFLVESYILDSQEMVNAVKAKGIKDATIGSWYTAFKIVDKDIFERCLKGEFNGFSVEAFLNMELSKNNFSVTNIEKKMKKTIIQKFKERLDSLIEEMSFKEALVPELNIKLTWGSVGDEVTKTYQDTEGNEKTEGVGAGEFVIEDGRTIVTDDNSALLEIREKPAEEKPVEEMAKEEEKVEEEMPEEEKKEEEEEEMPVSGDTKQKKTKEEICAECPDCPECLEEEEMAKEEMPEEEKKEEEEEKPVEDMPVLSGDTKTEDEKVEELPVDEEEFAPDGNTNACKHGGRSTDESAYCNGMGSPEKSTGTYKQGKKVKKEEDKKEDKPAEKKEEAPKAAEKPKKKEKDIKIPEATPEQIDEAGKTKSEKDIKSLLKQKADAMKSGDKAAKLDADRKLTTIYKKTAEDRVKQIDDDIAEEKRYYEEHKDDKDMSDGQRNYINATENRLKTMEENKKRYEDDIAEYKKQLETNDFSLVEFSSEEVLYHKFSALQENFAALQTENEALKAEVAALKVKLSEPIAEPKLKDVEIKGEVKELSVYELVARRNGLPTV